MTIPKGGGLKAHRIPGTLAEAEALVAYNERVLATSVGRERRARARRMLANLQPHLERLRAAEVIARVPRVPRSTAEYIVVWSGADRYVRLTE